MRRSRASVQNTQLFIGDEREEFGDGGRSPLNRDRSEIGLRPRIRSPSLNSIQKIYFKPNWISRGATDVLLITPKLAVPKFVPDWRTVDD